MGKPRIEIKEALPHRRPARRAVGGTVALEGKDQFKVTQTVRTTDQDGLVFCNPLMKQIQQEALGIAEMDVPVLIQGEKGVGKATIARVIHQASRPGKPFVRVNCQNLSMEVRVRELVGCQNGTPKETSFDRPGKVQFANGGTLYVEEICEFPLRAQATLIQVVKKRRCLCSGSDKEMDLDVRIIASTRHRLKNARNSGALHEDWYDQLSAVELEIPPLRQRTEEIPLLCAHFLESLGRRYNKTVNPIPEKLIKSFEIREWNVENVKELEDAVNRYILGQ